MGRSVKTVGDTNLHVHHIVPLKDGGSNNSDNLTTLCKECHDAIHHNDKQASQRGRQKRTGARNSRVECQANQVEPEAIENFLILLAVVTVGAPIAIYLASTVGVEVLFGVSILSFVFLFTSLFKDWVLESDGSNSGSPAER